MEIFERLSQFMCKAGILEVGRDRLLQVRNKLELVLVTEELSENSLSQLLKAFACPVYRALSMGEVEQYFHLRGTKVVGFRRHPLSTQVHHALKGYIVRPVQELPEHPRVAVLGASGIGRHHANWWHLEGADVVAFLGSSRERLGQTSETLKALFGFEGRGYLSLDELLEAERPDIVDVCLPPHMHYEASLAAVQAGCHVLCEKPFVFDETLDREQLLTQTEEVARVAGNHGLRLGGCTQYAVAARLIFQLWQEAHPGECLERFEGILGSPIRDREPNPSHTWIDLAPHLLMCAQILSGNGAIDCSTLRRDFDGYHAAAEFVMSGQHRRELACRIETFHRDASPANVRQLVLNGSRYDIGGFKDSSGVYQMRLTTPEGEVRDGPDLLRQLIQHYLRGKIDVPHSLVYHNMLLLFHTLGREL